MIYNYQILIEYDGTNFIGWQAQKRGRSIQGKIEKALKKYFNSKIKLIGSGRTDKGVHAKEQSANFFSNHKITNKEKFLNSINYFIKSDDISILKINKKNLKFHSRFSAKYRIYEYVIINRQSKLSIDLDRAWHIKKRLSLTLMKKGARILKGTHDYSLFRSSSCGATSPIRTIKKISIIKKNDKIILSFTSRSFLQQQVRSMVGCLKYLGEKKWTLKQFKNNFNSKKRSNCAPPAPPYGLFLAEIKY